MNFLLDVLNIFKKFVEMDDLDEKVVFDFVGVEIEEKEKIKNYLCWFNFYDCVMEDGLYYICMWLWSFSLIICVLFMWVIWFGIVNYGELVY